MIRECVRATLIAGTVVLVLLPGAAARQAGSTSARQTPARDSAAAHTYPRLLEVGDRSKLIEVPPARLIAFTLYTLSRGVLKLSAQLHPLAENAVQEVALDLWGLDTGHDDQWHEIARAPVHPIGWTATFRVTPWDMTRDVRFRVRHAGGSTYEGLVRHDPVEKRRIVVAAFTGNSPGPGGGAISKQDVVDSVSKLDPDLLVFTGDQVYNHQRHTEFWLEFGKIFGPLMRDRPTVTIPDDHDVGQPNLWGQGGRKIDRDSKGGYTRPAEYVKLVERQQTSHLPDPYDPTPIAQGIGVYYTSMIVGGIDFAIVEDRKFKSGCFGLVPPGLGPRPDHIDKPDYDPKSFDLPDKTLLGPRQLDFLEHWSTDWTGAVMKAVVSQTVWSLVSTHHGANKTFYYADFDSDGWPQTGRNKAIDILRRCFAFQICGDQHLATLVQYGIDDWRDAGWAFCVPSIANLWPRWWEPKQEGRNAEPGAQPYTGDFLDGFGNKITVYAHTNPYKTGREPAQLHDRMPGFGVVRFDKEARTITVECWPRMVDPTDPANRERQYPGWPRTISQFDNYGRRALAWLPDLHVQGREDPLVQVIDQASNKVVYALRIKGKSFRPKVFHKGIYTVVVGEGEGRVILEGLEALSQPGASALEVTL